MPSYSFLISNLISDMMVLPSILALTLSFPENTIWHSPLSIFKLMSNHLKRT